MHRCDILLDVNPLLKLGIALRVFPELDALSFDCKEWEPTIEEDLSGVAGLACAPLSNEDITLSPWQEAEVDAGALQLKVH